MRFRALKSWRTAVRPRFVAFGLLLIWGMATILVFNRLKENAQGEIWRLAEARATGFKVKWISRPDDESNHHLFRIMRNEYFDGLTDTLKETVFLTWVDPVSKAEVLIYPTDSIGRSVQDLENKDTIKIALIDKFHQPVAPSGYLYFQVDFWQKWSTPVTFLLAAMNVLLLLLILLYWLSRLSQRYEASQFELEQKKQELIQLEQLALAGKLSAGLLHDLKKPVIHIREECRDGLTPGSVKDISEQSDLFLAMLRDSGLEDFARRRSSEPEYCDLIDLVERSLRLVEYERNDVQVRVSVQGEIPLVKALPTRLMQVFSNLILNAYQAMSGKGILSIDLHTEQLHEERNAVIEVTDTGPGIPPEHAPHVFQPFFTTGKGGSGLGLYICKTIVEDLGGSISLSGPPEGGTLFRVILPEGGKSEDSQSVSDSRKK
jgi:signal transduction histidine kinase